MDLRARLLMAWSFSATRKYYLARRLKRFGVVRVSGLQRPRGRAEGFGCGVWIQRFLVSYGEGVDRQGGRILSSVTWRRARN